LGSKQCLTHAAANVRYLLVQRLYGSERARQPIGCGYNSIMILYPRRSLEDAPLAVRHEPLGVEEFPVEPL
jgi:hypothetical protein